VRDTGVAAPVLIGVLASLVVFTSSRVGIGHHLAFAGPGPIVHPLVPILVVLPVVWCLARRRYRRDRWEQRGPRLDDREEG
jgi:hypothetical protein